MTKNTILETILLTDGYKLDHRRQYPQGTQYVYCNFTPRSNNWYPEARDGAVVFGIQMFVKKYLVEKFNKEFFDLPLQDVLDAFDRRVSTYLGKEAAKTIGHNHIENLHKLGYLPVHIKALPEGTLCSFGVPMLTITNTHPDFFWLPNYLETLLSSELWLPMTSATTARLARKQLQDHAENTGFSDQDLTFLCHDFSMRGMAGTEAAIMSAIGHLTSFTGSETIPAFAAAEEYYMCDAERENLACTVPATEHSVMCAGGKESEIETFRRLLTKVYPNGFVSVVSDTWDYWQVITDFLPKLKDLVMSREGRLVIRPDSGDPVDIICGVDEEDVVVLDGKQYYVWGINTKHDAQFNEEMWKKLRTDSEFAEKHFCPDYKRKGTYQCLLEIFGGKTNEKGYKVLDPHIGLIYGDSITLEKQKRIYEKLEKKGFAATNLVLGFGSYTYQLKSRDSLGFAMKATFCVINGKEHDIFKSPKTDNGVKKSLKGRLMVYNRDGIKVKDQCTAEEEKGGLLRTVFIDGQAQNEQTLSEIRQRITKTL